jgi:cytidyltransferase-like protein
MILDLNRQQEVIIFRRGLSHHDVIGVTSGCFDLLHYLHLIYLQRCRRLCDILVVGVNSDRLVKDEKGPGRPIIPEHQRLAMVNSLSCVDAAFVMDDVQDFSAIIHILSSRDHPVAGPMIFKSQFFGAMNEDEIAGSDAPGAKVVIVPDVDIPDSTSAIITKAVQDSQPRIVEGNGD